MGIGGLSRFGGAVRKRATATWKLVVTQPERWLKWLQLKPQVRIMLLSVGISIATAYLLIAFWLSWYWYSFEETDDNGVTHHPHADILNPIAAALGGAVLAWAAFRQARTATRQAEIASERHKAQTDADRQRRLTESYGAATRQLASDKLEERLGGIYTLERVLRESPDDYWPVMETLTAFIRERTRQDEYRPMIGRYVQRQIISQELHDRIARRAYFLWQDAGSPGGRDEYFWISAASSIEAEGPPTDVAAVLSVIRHQSRRRTESERANGLRLNFLGAVLRRGDLRGAYLDGARFSWTHLESAMLDEAHLEGADFGGAYMQKATLGSAYLKLALFLNTHMHGVDFSGVHDPPPMPGSYYDKTTRWPNGWENGRPLGDLEYDGGVWRKRKT